MLRQGLAGLALVWFFALFGCGDTDGCDPDPPCDVAGIIEVPLSVVFPAGQAQNHVVTLEVGEESVAVTCTVRPEGEATTCEETERVGLEGWLMEPTILGPPSGPQTLQLELDRGDDDTPGPARISLSVQSPLGFSVQNLGPQRRTVSTNGATCRQCWFDLPETL